MANKNNTPDKRVLIIRIICIVLAVLMFGGVIVAAVLSAQAADIEEITEEKQVFKPDDYLIRVGLCFSDTTQHSHRVRTQNKASGFELYETTKSNELKYIWTLGNGDVSVSETGNLRRSSSSGWYYYSSQSNTVAGGYHLQIIQGFDNREEAENGLSVLSEKAKTLNVPVYPAYINGIYYIRIGAYTSVSAAESEKAVIEETLECECEITEPTQSSLTVIDYETALVLFDFDMTEAKYGLGLYCIGSGENNCIKTEKGYLYDGVMEFRRYKASGVDGVTMILISELETYVICVVPWEIYNTWPTETMKAFSVCARTFVIANSHKNAKHKAYDCDVCSTSDCQVCKGFERVNNNVINGVMQTKGEILLCDGKPVTTYYTDLGGGSMAAAHEVWNMDAVKYLVGQMTPWEDLSVSKYGAWSFTATPEELLQKVRAAGYTTLSGAIEDVRINRLCENSTYVYSITITDIYGVSVTINRCRNVRAALSGLMYAANFVIEHNGRIDDGKSHAIKETVSGIYVMTADGIKTVNGEESIHVMTEGGLKQQYLPQRITVKTSSSLVSQTVLINTTEIIGQPSSSDSKNFTFIGSGNGHGVGASQWGCKDLGNLGYKYDRILYTYYPHTELAFYTDYISN